MTEGDYLIRHPDISDLEDIVHINRISLPENYPVAYFIELIRTWKDTSCVVELNKKVVGYNLMRIEGASFSPWKQRSSKKGHIISIAVHPDARRMGFGRMMMEYVMDLAKGINGIKEITLEVRVSNLPAIQMYKKLNFVSHKILKGYYSDGEDALLMKYKL